MPQGKLVLIVEDESDIRELIVYNLVRHGFQTAEAGTGEEALQKITEIRPDLILLDLMLPGIEGLEVCRQLKSNPATHAIPVIIVSARGEETDIVLGLEFGADDYVCKPFSPRVLLARVRSVLRRAATMREEKDKGALVSLGPISIDADKYSIRVNNEVIGVTPTEFAIMKLLAEKPGKVFTRKQIIDGIRGGGYAVSERTIDVHVLNLRKKLGEAGKLLETIRGIGYCVRECE
ncbi:MAG: DNA-binding response regulator [Lentisphaerae bacterium]|nr:MAG: DNA-binding response regulator [Lentisphaerota bacterium]